MDLSVIIVSFNTKDFLEECLKSLITNYYSLITDHEIIVVDNGSSDGSPEMVKSQFPKVKLVENRENVGFARAASQGFSYVQGKYILLLNPDTEVKEGALEKLVAFFKNEPKAGVIGARLLDPDGTVQASVYHLPTIGGAIREYWLGQKGAYEKYAPKGEKPVEVEAVTGAAMLFSQKTIEKIGFLDKGYFMYFEDLDYCRRARRAGLKVYYLPEAEIIHHHGKSAAKVGSKAYQYLTQSSKIYNGLLKYYLLYLIIRLGQVWRKNF